MFVVSEGPGPAGQQSKYYEASTCTDEKKNNHFRDGGWLTHLGDFHRVLGGAAGVVLHLVPLDDFFKPAEGKKKRAGGETKKLEVNVLLK